MEEETRRASDGRMVPVIPALPDLPVPAQSPNPIIAVCGVCNLELRQVMHYVCGHDRCPAFPRATC